MAKINAASILVLCLIHVMTSPATSKGYYPFTHTGEDIINMCEACEMVVYSLYHQVQEKEAHNSSRKSEIVQLTKNICNSSSSEADWIFNIDIVERGNRWKLEQTTGGKCNSKYKIIEGACQKVMRSFSKDVARYIYESMRKSTHLNLHVQLLCRNFSMACNLKPPRLPKSKPGAPCTKYLMDESMKMKYPSEEAENKDPPPPEKQSVWKAIKNFGKEVKNGAKRMYTRGKKMLKRIPREEVREPRDI
ncbi:hypothetical protein BT93_L3882 [Corymbia citriodora subsp. variegata]|uniref:Saposin B-type domain-containing protein n=1 Tax=Corymbia citriodora subsp. variegata TaxID=360336 RepID=A0A8T0CWE1_CORYI|nr:hypothetical protein BT93_L3882 [Corymbia citriodora subsp. variegata]